MYRVAFSLPASACALLRAVLLWLVLMALATPVSAQDETPFWPVHGGDLLPAGTALVVLEQPGEPGPTGSIQPVFLALDEYPRTTSRTIRRDTLGARGRTTSTYPRTQEAGILYFLYARTPEGQLYASYSADRGRWKFDVAETGAMSVAPVTDEATRAEIGALFFEPERETEDVITERAAPDPESEPPADAAEETSALNEDRNDNATEDDPAPDVATQGNANTLTAALGFLSLFLLACTVFLYMRYRRLRTEHERLLAAEATAEDLHHMKQELAAMEEKYQAVRASCQTLLDRYDRLSKQLERTRRITEDT